MYCANVAKRSNVAAVPHREPRLVKAAKAGSRNVRRSNRLNLEPLQSDWTAERA